MQFITNKIKVKLSTNLTFWIVSVNPSSSHLWSLIISFTGKPLILAFRKSGTWQQFHRVPFKKYWSNLTYVLFLQYVLVDLSG